MLFPHRLGLDSIFASDQKPTLAPRTPPKTTRPVGTTEDMLKLLPGSDRSLSLHVAELLVRDFNQKKDRELWSQIVEHVCEPIRLGIVSIEAALKAYRYAMRPKTKNRGSYFWDVFQKNLPEDWR